MTPAVFDEALARGVSMIVSYHPPIFSGLKSLTLANPLQASLLRCAAAGISVYSPHTALDSVHGGVNDWLAGCIRGTAAEGQGKVEVLLEHKDAEERALGGDGRVVRFATPISMDALVGRVKTGLGLQQSNFFNICSLLPNSPLVLRNTYSLKQQSKSDTHPQIPHGSSRRLRSAPAQVVPCSVAHPPTYISRAK
jgi:putative NIF3 family GTP cyclohydrolase 1 type 2